jgi:protein TonB
VATALLAGYGTGCATDQQIEPPAPLFQEVPVHYPLELWDRDVEGETLVRVRVSDTGTVTEVEILESSGIEAFDSAAVAGAMEMRFEPARRNGRRIEVWARLPVRFTKRPGRGGGA